MEFDVMYSDIVQPKLKSYEVVMNSRISKNLSIMYSFLCMYHRLLFNTFVPHNNENLQLNISSPNTLLASWMFHRMSKSV